MITILDNYTGSIGGGGSPLLLALLYGDVATDTAMQPWVCQWSIITSSAPVNVSGARGFCVDISLDTPRYSGDIDEIAAGLIDGVMCVKNIAEAQKDKALEYLLYHFGVYNEECVSQSEKKIDLVSTCVSYFENHIDEHISLDDLAHYCQKSKVAISKAFSRDQGMGPLKVLAQMRIEKATALLEAQELTISQISHSTGFSDVSTFSHFYKRHTGKSPRSIQQAAGWVI